MPSPSPSCLSIRRAEAGDVATLLELVAQYWAFEQLPGFDRDALRPAPERLVSSPALGSAWIATGGDAVPLGYLLLVYVFSLEHRGLTAQIDELRVVPARRGSGVGAALLREAEAEAARRGCTNLSLQIATSNDRARSFYARHGYSGRAGFALMDKGLA